jgi:DHA1 family bicyclomycin/chloramphenicol resistance-like MFS transporter
MLRPDTFSLTAMLALLTAVGPLSVDMYLPSLPDIGRELAAPPAQVQLTISFYLVGFALGQILYGPLSDCHGRKPILLAALALFGTASLACAFAWSIEMLIAAFKHLAERGRSSSRAPSSVTSIPRHVPGANSRSWARSWPLHPQ